MSVYRIVIRDDAEPSYLRWLWLVGASLLSRAAVIVAARSWSWDSVYKPIYDAVRAAPDGTTHIDLQFWGHGSDGAPMIGGSGPAVHALMYAISSALEDRGGELPTRVSAWWRNCHVHRGRQGKAFASYISSYGVESIGHCDIIAWPNPLRQREVCGLRAATHGERPQPWWPDDGAGLPSVGTLLLVI